MAVAGLVTLPFGVCVHVGKALAEVAGIMCLSH